MPSLGIKESFEISLRRNPLRFLSRLRKRHIGRWPPRSSRGKMARDLEDRLTEAHEAEAGLRRAAPEDYSRWEAAVRAAASARETVNSVVSRSEWEATKVNSAAAHREADAAREAVRRAAPAEFAVWERAIRTTESAIEAVHKSARPRFEAAAAALGRIAPKECAAWQAAIIECWHYAEVGSARYGDGWRQEWERTLAAAKEAGVEPYDDGGFRADWVAAEEACRTAKETVRRTAPAEWQVYSRAYEAIYPGDDGLTTGLLNIDHLPWDLGGDSDSPGAGHPSPTEDENIPL